MEGLTAAEEAELRQLQAEQQAEEDRTKGNQVVAQMDRHQKTPRPHETRPFSLYRMTVGGFRDAIQNVFDTVEDAGNEVRNVVGSAQTRLGEAALDAAKLLPIGQALDVIQGAGYVASKVELPHLKGEENAGTVERIGRGVVSFLAPFTGWSKAFGIAKATSWLGRAGVAMAAGAATDVTMPPEQTNLANAMRDVFGIDNDTLDALASEEDDNRLVARFKAAAVNAPVSLLTDAVLETGLRGVRAYKAWRGSFEEADAAVKAARSEVPVLAPEVEQASAEGASAGTKRAKATIDETMRVKPEEHPENFEDVLDFLKRKADLGEMDEELLSRFAQNLVEGDPENALAKMGIDPLKMDYSAFDDPAMLQRMHAGLAEIYEGIAKRLGRSGTRVTEEATATAARTLATTADVLKDLYGHTANLAETMYASRLFVGSHSAKLVAEAEKALAAIKAGGGDAEWLSFLESFQRHAYFLGALRGAGSEVGRALRQLQMVVKVGRKSATKTMEEAKLAADAAHTGASGAREVALQATDAVSAMSNPAERILFLGKLIDKSGDIGDLSRFTRTKAGSTLKRLDAALGETRGNLFSAGTGVLNTLSGLSMVGMRSLAKSFAAIGRMALSPLGGRYSQAARVQLLQSWAYVDGALGAWRDAYRNTLALLEQEGMEEVAINAHSLGLEKLATASAKLADEGRQASKGNFERVDISNSARPFAMKDSDLQALYKTIDEWDTPALMQHSMKWLVRALAVPVNAAGTLSRLGTILFINASDRLVGTIAARAGAQEAAMKIAAKEAAELQLEGRDLTAYMKARMVQLTETVDGFADDAYSAGQREAVNAAGEHEAKEVLFQDQLETGAARTLVGGLNRVPFFHLFVPFVKTPLRILERTALDYTPLGLVKDRIRADIMAGGPRRDEALARVGLGMLMVYTAYQLAEDRTVIGNDGGYKSSSRLSRPSYTLQIGDDHYEFVRIDPIGTLLGMGADFHQFMRDQEDIPPQERDGMAKQLIEAAGVMVAHNILSKTWLTSLKNLTELAGINDDDEFSTRLSKYAQSFGARFMPASGIQRSIQKGIDGVNRDAADFMDGLMKASVGAGELPVKRDYLLGRPLPYDSGERLFGARFGPGASDVDDPLLAELDRLSYDIPAAHRTVMGVKLSSAQFNRWLELKGQVVRNPRTGLTGEEALRELIQLPEYQSLPRAGKVQAIRDQLDGYASQATEALFDEDKDFAMRALRRQTFDKMRLVGAPQKQIDSTTADLAKQLGLQPQ